MDYRKINSHIILLLIVFIVGLTIAMLGRLIVLDKGADTGTANLTFVIILGVCIIAYLIILATLAHIIVPWIIKKLPNKKKSAPATMENRVSNEKEETSKQFAEEDIRQNYTRAYVEKQNEKINLFLKYTYLIMTPHITDDESLRLEEYIRCYAGEEFLSKNLIPIKPCNLKNPDIFHFGWNMAHYFGYKKQNVVLWLQTVFFDLRELESSYIKGKLYDGQTEKYIIPNIDNVPKYLAKQNK
jgi:hypothetical protein